MLKAMFRKSRKDEQGQALSMLIILMMIPLAFMLSLSQDSIRQLRNIDVAYSAAVSASRAAHSGSHASFNNVIDESAGVISACQAMDSFLPAQLLAVSFAPGGVTVRVSIDSGDDEIRAVATSEWDALVTSDEDQSPNSDTRNYLGYDLARDVPECRGRAN